MDRSERVRILENNLSRLLGWVSAADSRIGLILALDTAMLGSLAALAPRASGWEVAPAIFSTLAGGALLTSLLLLSFASFPTTSGPRGSLIFFEGIASSETDAYLQSVNELTEEQYLDDLAKQCHRNAEIARKKFKWVRWSLSSLYLAVLPWALAVYLLYQRRP